MTADILQTMQSSETRSSSEFQSDAYYKLNSLDLLTVDVLQYHADLFFMQPPEVGL